MQSRGWRCLFRGILRRRRHQALQPIYIHSSLQHSLRQRYGWILVRLQCPWQPEIFQRLQWHRLRISQGRQQVWWLCAKPCRGSRSSAAEHMHTLRQTAMQQQSCRWFLAESFRRWCSALQSCREIPFEWGNSRWTATEALQSRGVRLCQTAKRICSRWAVRAGRDQIRGGMFPLHRMSRVMVCFRLVGWSWWRLWLTDAHSCRYCRCIVRRTQSSKLRFVLCFLERSRRRACLCICRFRRWRYILLHRGDRLEHRSFRWNANRTSLWQNRKRLL